MKKVLEYFAAYLLLSVILLLGLWIFFLGREVLTGLLRTYFVSGSFQRGYEAGFYDRMLTLLLGLGWMALFVVAEELLRRRITKGKMLKVFFRFMGVETLLTLVLDGILLIFLTDAVAQEGLRAVGWARWLILVAELLFGALFVFLGWSKRSPWYEKRKSGVLENEPRLSL